MPKQTLYNWNDGKGKVHTIPKTQHAQNVEAKSYGIDLNAPASQPLTTGQTYGQATKAADLEYGPQITAATNVQNALPSWYGDYLARVGAAQTQQQQYAANVLAPVQAAAQQAATAAPGLDANSAAGQASQQAATSGQGLAQLGYSTLAAIPLASNQFYGGLGTTAARDQISAQAMQAQKVGDLKQARGAAIVKNYGDYRAGEQNAQIAYGTLDLNNTKAADDAANDLLTSDDKRKARKAARKTAREKTAAAEGKTITSGPFAGETNASVQAMSPAEKKKRTDAYNAKSTDAADKKHEDNISKAAGKANTAIEDINNFGQTSVGKELEDKTQAPTYDAAGNAVYPKKKFTQKDVDEAKVAKYGMLGRIAIAIRDGRPLDDRAVKYLRSKYGKDFRIPRAWLKGKPSTPAQDSDPHGTGGASEPAPGGTGHI